MSDLLNSIKNKIDFFLRQKLKFSRKNYWETPEPKAGLFDEPASLKEKALLKKYNLEFVKDHTTKLNYQENLYTIDLLDKHFDIKNKSGLRVLDIGCKNWFYAKGEYFFFKNHCEKLTLNGIELDANRLYSNFYSRGEVAKFQIKSLENTTFIAGDFIKHTEKYDYMVWILPFVFETPMLKWGLPKHYFKPKEMLKHAFELLNEDGKIFIINQGQEEYEEQKILCKELNLKYKDIGLIQSEFLNDKIARYSIIVEK